MAALNYEKEKNNIGKKAARGERRWSNAIEHTMDTTRVAPPSSESEGAGASS